MPPDPLETAIFFRSFAPEDLRPQIVARWRRYLKQRVSPTEPVFGPWHDLMALADADFSTRAGTVVARWLARPRGTEPGQLNPLIAELLASASRPVACSARPCIRRIDPPDRRGGTQLVGVRAVLGRSARAAPDRGHPGRP